jgi:hypothetical protein
MYKLVKPIFSNQSSTFVQRLSDGAFIPFDNDNVDYQKYLEWVSKGNTPTPADEGTQ